MLSLSINKNIFIYLSSRCIFNGFKIDIIKTFDNNILYQVLYMMCIRSEIWSFNITVYFFSRYIFSSSPLNRIYVLLSLKCLENYQKIWIYISRALALIPLWQSILNLIEVNSFALSWTTIEFWIAQKMYGF